MPSKVVTSVENNFTKGLNTESTGLNFPENAATETFNCTYTLIGDVLRREGIDRELNYASKTINRTNVAVSTFKWDNAGGDGNTQFIVEQVGSTLYFYKSSAATAASPVSTQIQTSTVNLTAFKIGTFDPTIECQFTQGNGYLFIFHPNCDPSYCTYNAGTGAITANVITIQIRDFIGVFDSAAITPATRPSVLTNEHQYNLQNQGWTAGNAWSAFSTTSNTVSLGPPKSWTVGAVAGLAVGQTISMHGYDTTGTGLTGDMSGNIIAYAGGIMTVQPLSASGTVGVFFTGWSFIPTSVGFLNTWATTLGNYPSNSDVWWYFKNTTGVFDPGTTSANVTLGSGNAPRGHYVLNAFNQDRSGVSGTAFMTPITTTKRPSTGCWFQGRVWYTGVNSSQVGTGNANFYTWTNNIYFSQVIQTITDFGICYQTNDPTSENLFDLLPTDGGVLTIPEAANIFKLFPISNGLLVFAANGVWFITGSQGIGFSANDYTVTKISSVSSFSSFSFVDVQGLPYFWNQEGIYAVHPAQGAGGQLSVEPLTVGTILTFYNSIPISSKKYARGAYHPLDYNIQWIFKSTVETTVTDRYTFDSILNFNVFNKAFYPYTVDTTKGSLNSIIYIQSPGTNTSIDPNIKYIVSIPASGSYSFSFGDEHDTSYKDWASTGTGADYTSYFVIGYKLHGQALYKTQSPYIYVYSRLDDGVSNYKIKGRWDYALSGHTGRWSVEQIVLINNLPDYSFKAKKHRIRGRGLVLQIQISSVSGEPFDIAGWSTYENINTGV